MSWRRPALPGVFLAMFLGGCAGDGGKDTTDDTGPGGDDTGTGGLDLVGLPDDCGALVAQDGVHVTAAEASGLRDRLASASAGDVFLLEDGTYELTGGDAASNLAIPRGVTVRSASGNADAVVLEGGFATSELVTLGAFATLAEVTVSHAAVDAVVIRGVKGARIYGVKVVDPGDRGIAIVPDRGAWPDDAVVGCSTVTRTTECGIGIEGVQARDGRVYGATVDQPACEHEGIKFATGSRDTVIERSVVTTGGLVGIMVGDNDYGEGDERVYEDAGCPDRVLVGHYGGAVRNVFAVGGGVRVEDACGGTVAHVSAWGGDVAWAFSEDLVVANILGGIADGGGATVSGTMRASASDFVDADAGDLHLAQGSLAIDAGVDAGVADDIDGDARDASPDIGADEKQ